MAVHEPSFRYRVSFNDKEAMAVGRSKKEAKHAAAKALIDKLTGMNISDQFYQNQTKTVNPTTSNPNINFDENNQINNPIGILQEFCMQKKWPPPQYEVEIEVGRFKPLNIFIFKNNFKGHIKLYIYNFFRTAA